MFEDLIADLYARLYEINMPHLIEQATDENKEKMKVDHVLMVGEGVPETPTPSTTAPAADAPAPRGRTKGIARRDIQKRADTIVNTKLAPRAVATKINALGETEPPATPQGPGPNTGPTSAPRAKQVPSAGEGLGEQRDEHETADDTELSETDDTKLGDEGMSALFPPVTDAEEGATGDEGADEGDGDDDQGSHENEGDEGEQDGEQGATEVEGDEDEDMQEDDTKLDGEDKETPTADPSANDTETELGTGKRDSGDQDAMDITPSES